MFLYELEDITDVGCDHETVTLREHYGKMFTVTCVYTTKYLHILFIGGH